MSMVGKTVVKGHGLRAEGLVRFDANGNACFYWNGTGKIHAKCACGALSEPNITQASAKRWHRQHKAEVVSAAAQPPQERLTGTGRHQSDPQDDQTAQEAISGE